MTQLFKLQLSIFNFQFRVALIVLGVTSALRADTLWISSGGKGNPLAYPNVTVMRVQDGKIFFQTGGRETNRDFQNVTRMELGDEPALNQAEEAYAASKWDAATDGYVKVLGSTVKPWLKEWAATRLLESAQKSNRFDAAVTAYIALVQIDPGRAEKSKPTTLPDASSTYLTTAASQIGNALAAAKLPDDQQRALLTFLLEIQRAKKDSTAAAETAQKLASLTGAGPADTSAANAMAKLKLDGAAAAIDAKDFNKALTEVQAAKGIFTDPRDQAQAAYITAQASEGLAGDNPDAAKLKDIALAYMRVVANFKDAPGAPYAPESLFKVGAIHEKLNEPATALSLYEQIANQYKTSPLAAKATENINRLKSKAS